MIQYHSVVICVQISVAHKVVKVGVATDVTMDLLQEVRGHVIVQNLV